MFEHDAASDLLVPSATTAAAAAAATTRATLSDGSRPRRRRGTGTGGTDCSGDRDSVSSLPSTLAAYIHEEHSHSGGTDRCLAMSAVDRQS